MLTIDTDFAVDSPNPPSAPRGRPQFFDDNNDPPDSQADELPPALHSLQQQGEQQSGPPRRDRKAPDRLTFEELGQPRINFHSKPSARYGSSNLAFFGSVLSTLSMPRLPSWNCPNVIAAMNVDQQNQSQDPIEKCFEDLLKVSTCPLAYEIYNLHPLTLQMPMSQSDGDTPTFKDVLKMDADEQANGTT
jgi:hypothetical protein